MEIEITATDAFNNAAATLRAEAAALGINNMTPVRLLGRAGNRRHSVWGNLRGLSLTRSLSLGRVLAEGATVDSLRAAARTGEIRLIPDRHRLLTPDGAAVILPR